MAIYYISSIIITIIKNRIRKKKRRKSLRNHLPFYFHKKFSKKGVPSHHVYTHHLSQIHLFKILAIVLVLGEDSGLQRVIRRRSILLGWKMEKHGRRQRIYCVIALTRAISWMERVVYTSYRWFYNSRIEPYYIIEKYMHARVAPRNELIGITFAHVLYLDVC